MSPQDLLDAYYHPVYDRIWSNPALSVDQKVDSDLKALRKARDRILRETGYDIFPSKWPTSTP